MYGFELPTLLLTVVCGGKVVEQGSHNELMQVSGEEPVWRGVCCCLS